MEHQRQSTDMKGGKYPRLLVPLMLGFIFAIFTIILWWSLKQREVEKLQSVADSHAQKVVHDIQVDLDVRMKALSRMVSRWELHGGTTKAGFISDSQAYINDTPGLQAIEWVDPQFYVRWVIPLEGNEAAQNLNLAFESNRRTALEAARDERSIKMTDAIDLVQGGKGFLVYFPVFHNDRFEGFILAVFKVEAWLGHIFSVGNNKYLQEDFDILVSLNEVTIYAPEDWATRSNLRQSSREQHTILSNTFSVDIYPTNSFSKHYGSVLPDVLLSFGLVLSVLISIIVYLYLQTKQAIGVSHDINEALSTEILARENVEKILEAERSRLSFILEGTNVGTWEWNVQTGETVFNERWAEIVGYTLEEISPTNIETWTQLAHPEDLEQSGALLEKHFNGELDYYEFEARMRHKDGRWVWVFDRGKVATWSKDGKPILMCGTHQEITKRKEDEEKIRHMAEHDALTDLPGTRLANERITSAINAAKRYKTKVAILFIDLDGFKAINDSYGHDAGDALLVKIAERLTSATRPTDTIARIGGDEFLLIATDVSTKEDAAKVAEKVVKVVSEQMSFKGHEFSVGTSIGIALYPDDGSKPEYLIKLADDAMYAIKKSGKKGFAFAEIGKNGKSAFG